MPEVIDLPTHDVPLNRLANLKDRASESLFRQANSRSTRRDAQLAFRFAAVASLVLLAGDIFVSDVGFGSVVIFRGLAFVASALALLLISRVASGWSSFIIVAWQFAVTATSAPLVQSGSDLAVTVVLLLPVLFYLTAPINVGCSIAAGVASSVVLLVCHMGPAAGMA